MEWSSGPWQWHLTDGMGRAVKEKKLKWYKKRCDHHVTSAGQKKNPTPWQELNLDLPHTGWML